AHLGHKVLGLHLTAREETPMAGFPLAKPDHYLRLLLNAGHRVAVCEQMEPPGGGKIIRREVTRIATLGTVTEDELLDPRRPNHIAALVKGKGSILGLPWAALTAGTFHAADFHEKQIRDEFARLNVAECLLPDESME